jgi:selenocysteine lyase/cysteine desulfurase
MPRFIDFAVGMIGLIHRTTRVMSRSAGVQLRQHMPVTDRWAYLDHAAVAPLPAPTVTAMQQWALQAGHEGDTVWASWNHRVGQVRQRVAELINASRREVALVPNTTTGIGLVAEGFRWQSGDNVVTLDNEFPSNLFPWLNLADRGVQTRRVHCTEGKVDLVQLTEACDSRTRIVAVSWVGYASGWRLDVGQLAEMVHRRGALLMLDAIQGLGVFPLDVGGTEVDFVAADGHKWMLGPEGAGVLYVKYEHLARLRPLGVGWQSAADRQDFACAQFALRDEAARYEGGSLNIAGYLGLGESLDLLAHCGLSADRSPLADEVLELTSYAADQLVAHGAKLVFARDPAHASGIVTFSLPGHDPKAIRAHCLQQGVALSVRAGGLRLSAHAYNNQTDIDRLIDCLPSRESHASANVI